VPPSPGADRTIRLDEAKIGMLVWLWMRREGAYYRVVPKCTVLSEGDGVRLMVPRLPELPPETGGHRLWRSAVQARDDGHRLLRREAAGDADRAA